MSGSGGDRPELINEKIVGNGSFGTVYQATLVKTGEIVAIKKVLQDKRFKVSCAPACFACFNSCLTRMAGSRRSPPTFSSLGGPNLM